MIEAVGLTKKFDDFTAVEDLTLSVRSGELLALLGPNGAGKTTTVRMLSAILRPTSGTARINGCDVVTQADQVRRMIGMLTDPNWRRTKSSDSAANERFPLIAGSLLRQIETSRTTSERAGFGKISSTASRSSPFPSRH